MCFGSLLEMAYKSVKECSRKGGEFFYGRDFHKNPFHFAALQLCISHLISRLSCYMYYFSSSEECCTLGRTRWIIFITQFIIFFKSECERERAGIILMSLPCTYLYYISTIQPLLLLLLFLLLQNHPKHSHSLTLGMMAL